jgi:hypothetical protein
MENAKSVCFSVSDAITEPIKSRGVPARRSFWKKHVLDAIFIAAMAAITFYTSYNVLLTSFDPSFWSYVKQGYVPLGATIVPYHNPQHYPGDEPYLVIPEPMSLQNWAGLLSPFVVPLLTIGIEYIRYRRWKESTA